MPKSGRKLTPMMERYQEVKRAHPDALLLFRMGDFYELFYEDAQAASRALGLTLTSRDKGSDNPIPMAGFPYHSLDSQLQKLIRAGFRAAICDQVENPKQAKGLVRREVTQVVTPGTLTDDALLDPRASNFLACIAPSKEKFGLAWLELSTGRFFTMEVAGDHLWDELARIGPAECLVPEESSPFDTPSDGAMAWQSQCLVAKRPDWTFARDQAESRLLEHFGTSTLEGFDIDPNSVGVTAAGVLLEYVQETQKTAPPHIARLETYRRDNSLLIDQVTRRSLELTCTMRDGGREGSLLDTIDETVTPAGARLLADWLSNPLTDQVGIEDRLDAVETLIDSISERESIRDDLKKTYDLQRLTGRLATGRATPRDLGCLGQTLERIPTIKDSLANLDVPKLRTLDETTDSCPDLRAQIADCLVDEPPLLVSDGGMIRTGYSAELDELRDLARGGKEWIAAYQLEEQERTGIPNLKVGFNRVFGYYLEVTAAHASKVPDNYIRKQTLKNQERYITPQLKEHEEKVLRAEERALELEQTLFQELRDAVQLESRRLRATAEAVAELDVLAALATLATQQDYCRPSLTETPELDIRDGRHPVLDRLQPTGEFVPNDSLLGGDTGVVQIITGPNMAGKSTYIRQTALITMLAQMGSFVPARTAAIGIADRVFARVGASDELGKGQSTFMVEMTETARILNTATERSLVILDEIGRGTSTYDGISLAWAVTEFLHDQIACRTLFATHYHELTELAQTLRKVSNWNVAVHEDDRNVTFLHKIVPGTADKSYGIHVARLAGIPISVIERAGVILETLEADHLNEAGTTNIPARDIGHSSSRQLRLFGPEDHPLLDEIRKLEIDQLSPLAALQELHRLRAELTE